MNKVISSENAPKAIGPYSQAVVAGGFVYVSGMIPVDPVSGKTVEGGIRKQAEKVLDNLGAVLAASGLDFSDVAKTTVFLTDLNDFGIVNEIYAGYFKYPVLPARSTIQVGGLPKGSLIEIEAVAHK